MENFSYKSGDYFERMIKNYLSKLPENERSDVLSFLTNISCMVPRGYTTLKEFIDKKLTKEEIDQMLSPYDGNYLPPQIFKLRFLAALRGK